MVFSFSALLFVCRLLDFTHAVGSELVELDTCLLAEEPLQDLHEEHGELPPEPPTLQQPVSTTSFSGVTTVRERHGDREKVGLSPKEAMKLGGGEHAPAMPSSCPPVLQLCPQWQNTQEPFVYGDWEVDFWILLPVINSQQGLGNSACLRVPWVQP